MKKKATEKLRPLHPSDFECDVDESSDVFCCAVTSIGDFKDAAFESYSQFWDLFGGDFPPIPDKYFSQEKDRLGDLYSDELIPPDWSKMPRDTAVALKRAFCGVGRFLLATTIIQYSNGKVPGLDDNQGKANKVLSSTGWKRVQTFRGNTNNLLQLWSFDSVAVKKTLPKPAAVKKNSRKMPPAPIPPYL